MLIFSWILGQVLGSWEWGVGSQGRAEVTGGRDSRSQGEAPWGAGQGPGPVSPQHRKCASEHPLGEGVVVLTSPHSPSSGSGGHPSCSLMLLSDDRSPGSVGHAIRWGLCSLYHHSLLPSSLWSPGHSPLFSEDRAWLPSSPPHLLNSGRKHGSAVPNLFGTRDWFRGRPLFHRPGAGGWFGDDSSTSRLLCSLFLT